MTRRRLVAILSIFREQTVCQDGRASEGLREQMLGCWMHRNPHEG